MPDTPRLRTRFLTALLFVAILAAMFVKIKTIYNLYDEGFAVFDATRVLNGEAPYKDFWGIYPPGQFTILATLFRVFGNNLMTARLYDTGVRILLTIGAYLVARKLASRGVAALAALVIGFVLAAAGFYSYAMFPAMMLGVWAAWAWLTFAERRASGWLALCGVLLGVMALVRWDMALYAAAGLLGTAYLYLLACPLSAAQPALNFRKITLRGLLAPLPALAWALAPLLLIAGLGYAAVGINSGWDNLYDQVFHFPATMLHAERWLAYPKLLIKPFPINYDWWRFYLPIAILVPAALVYAVRFLRDPAGQDWKFFGVLSLILFGGLLFNQGLSRYDSIHVMPATIVTYLVCAALFARAIASSGSVRSLLLLYFLMAIPTFIYFQPAYHELLATMDMAPPWGCYSKLDRLACVAVMSEQEQVAEYLRTSARPGDTLYVGNTRHDKIFVNDAGLYYLAGLPSATRYNELHPGVANTLPVQKEIAAGLEARQARWVVLVEMWESTEPNDSAVSTGVTYLDQYIREKYRQVLSLGWYRVMERRK